MSKISRFLCLAIITSILLLLIAGCSNKEDTAGNAFLASGASELKNECNDRLDNDGDGAIDRNDVGCRTDTGLAPDETNCGDGVCEGGEMCGECVEDCGECEPDNCYDSDELDLFTFGYVKGIEEGNPFYYEDYCRNISVIVEYFCDKQGHWGDMRSLCQNGCSNGACVAATTTTTLPAACVDTDGGKNFDVKGTCTDGTFTFTDSCNPNVFGRVNEAYCNDLDKCSFGAFDNVCPNGCYDGQCVPTNTTTTTTTIPIFNTCFDSDGLDYFTLGFVNGTDEGNLFFYQDYCQNISVLIEYFCDNQQNLGNARIWCQNYCMNGTCNPE
ncbi:hypothetical protein JW930_02665 [Candidatus Woesearchaeota archaeon]|nr:hypothetical protein [Candidatus Woesearchaeota archaeon]